MNDWKTIDLKDYISKEGSPWNCFETIPMRHYVDDKKTEYTATCPVCHDDGSSLHVRWERFQKKVSFYCDRGHSLENILNAFGIKTKTERMKKQEEIKKKVRRERRKLNGEDRKSRKATTEKGVETGIILVRPNLPVEDAKLDLKIDEEFHNLIPPISKDEYGQLADNILFGGCRDPIVVWDGIIIDGHNRYEICQKHGIEFKTLEKSFNSRDDAKIWIIRNQLGRRNISDYDRVNLTLELKPMIAAKARGRMLSGKADPTQKSAEGETREELATIAGISHDTIHKVEVIEKEAPPEIKEAARSGKISINKAYKETKGKQKTEEPVYSEKEYPETSALKEGQSRNLALLKDAWLRANQTDRRRFFNWQRERGDLKTSWLRHSFTDDTK